MKWSFNPSSLIRQKLVEIKTKIVNFDIKPARPIIAELLLEADAALAAGDDAKAEKILRKVLLFNNTNLQALELLVDLYMKYGKLQDAKRLLKHTLKLAPNEYMLHSLLGRIYLRQGFFQASAACFKRTLALCPEAATAKHLLDAVTHNKTTIAPRDYIINLFDDYAANFEHSLINTLCYRTPEQLTQFLHGFIKDQQPIPKVLDLGCGTGLLGQMLAKEFQIQNLIGVDLSSQMLAHSKAKNVYHALHNADLIEYLQSAKDDIDIIASSDVLVYVGDLAPVLEQSYRTLKPGGFCCFSVEKLWWGNYKLAPNGRYQHSLWYIKSLYKRYQFSKMYSQTIDLRKESGKMVAGYLVLLQK